MLYWLGVYLLVATGVAVPFLLLYLVGLVMWLCGRNRFHDAEPNGCLGSSKRLFKSTLERPLAEGGINSR